MPGGGIAASVLKTVSTADLSARRQTTAELRNEIEEKMASLNLSFIVVLDDLDRLEPTQAVEVLRLIRSVADFSGFHYVLCYDPDVLGHAVEQGLHVGDGRHYLQKIIPVWAGAQTHAGRLGEIVRQQYRIDGGPLYARSGRCESISTSNNLC